MTAELRTLFGPAHESGRVLYQTGTVAEALRAKAAGADVIIAQLIGQDAGLIRDIPAAGELGERIVAEAEALLKDRLPKPVWAS